MYLLTENSGGLAPLKDGGGHSGKHLLIIAAPRSASTFAVKVAKMITALPECPPRIYSRKTTPLTMFSNLHEEDWTGGLRGLNTIGKLHCSGATTDNLRIIVENNIQIVFLYRDIFDSLVSLVDHHDGMVPTDLFWGSHWVAMSRNDKIQAVIDYYLSQFLFQYVMWTRFCIAAGTLAVSLNYNVLAERPALTMEAFLGHAGIEFDEDWLHYIVSAATGQTKIYTENVDHEINFNLNINKAIKGRGRDEMSDKQIQHIERIVEFYPDVDFSHWGIRG